MTGIIPAGTAGTHRLMDPLSGKAEAIILCPVERHPDVILKVSAILKSQVFEAPPDISFEKPVLYRSELAKKLACPTKPQAPVMAANSPNEMRILILGFTILFAVLGALALNEIMPGAALLGFVLGFIISGPIVFLLVGKTSGIGMATRGDSYATRLNRWKVAKARWENAYFCQRHDIVFIKGQDRAIPVEKFQACLLSDED